MYVYIFFINLLYLIQISRGLFLDLSIFWFLYMSEDSTLDYSKHLLYMMLQQGTLQTMTLTFDIIPNKLIGVCAEYDT